MSRDDSLLYSGVSSASFKTVRTIREKATEDKLEKQTKLTPAAEVVAEVIQQERTKVTAELANLPLTVNTSKENVKELLMAYQRNLKFIDSFEIKMANALRKANR